MEFIVGAAIALFVCGAAAALGMDRDRVFYPNVVMVTATYYVLFAVIDGRPGVLWSETSIAAVFIVLAVAGFRRSPWLVVLALLAHGVMDCFHDELVHNAGVPGGWPGFCLTFDLTAAAMVAMLLLRRSREDGRSVPDAGVALPLGRR
jgi:hypothetical protein